MLQISRASLCAAAVTALGLSMRAHGRRKYAPSADWLVRNSAAAGQPQRLRRPVRAALGLAAHESGLQNCCNPHEHWLGGVSPHGENSQEAIQWSAVPGSFLLPMATTND
ncbi:MAG: hypothetical protein IIZ92_23380, partial [Aquincola sp.]|nr:hypothetical protein [Aquincola sp.]